MVTIMALNRSEIKSIFYSKTQSNQQLISEVFKFTISFSKMENTQRITCLILGERFEEYTQIGKGRPSFEA